MTYSPVLGVIPHYEVMHIYTHVDNHIQAHKHTHYAFRIDVAERTKSVYQQLSKSQWLCTDDNLPFCTGLCAGLFLGWMQ